MFAFLSALGRLLGKVFSPIRQLAEDDAREHVDMVAVLAGMAFGPEGIRHFSRLSTQEQWDLFQRVPALRGNHDDWPRGLDWIPRSTTAYLGPRPVILAGNTDDPKPIPDRGKWFVARGYFAWTSRQGIHIRVGFRYDDVDNYFEFPSFTIKKFV